MPHDEDRMRECFLLAQKGKGFVSPNPMVGAILEIGGRIVARGYHVRFGSPHAEVDCLRRFSGEASKATLYVNLEPCSIFAKTPPCVDLILQRGIKSVVVAMKDPNPLIRGNGITRLRRAGVNVKLGVLKDEALYINRVFVKHITTGVPYVHLKVAQTIDGFIARERGAGTNISSVTSRTLVHKWRSEYDAVLVGAGTVIADDPQLNVRFSKGRNPDVVIVDGNLRVRGTERVFNPKLGRRVFLCTGKHATRTRKKAISKLKNQGVIVLECSSTDGVLKMKEVLKRLHSERIGSILIEGGNHIFSQFIEARLVDELSIFISPKTFHRGVPAFSVNALNVVQSLARSHALVSRKVGTDTLLTGII